MKQCKTIEENLYLYYLEALTPNEKSELDQHIKNCPACSQKLKENHATLNMVNQRKVPEQTPQFWDAFDTGLASKLTAARNRSRQSNKGVWDFIKESWKKMNQIQLPVLPVRLASVLSAAVVILVVGLVMVTQKPWQNIGISPVVSIQTPQHIVAKKQPVPDSQAVESQSGQIKALSVSDEILIQEMLLLAELGENLELSHDDDLEYEAELLSKYSTN